VHSSQTQLERRKVLRLREREPARELRQARQTRMRARSMARVRPMHLPKKTCASMPMMLVAAMRRPLVRCRRLPAE